MKDNKGIIIFSLLILASFIVSSPNVQAQIGVGASPATIHFDNMLRDGYAEGYVTVSVSKEEFVSASATPFGEVAEWIIFPDGPYFQVNKKNPNKIKIVINPPSDVANGIYDGYIRFTTSPLGEITSGAGSAIQVSLDVRIFVEITDIQILRCKANSFAISDAEEGQPVLLSTNIFNSGNVRITPSALINVWNKRQDKIVDSFSLAASKEVLPTSRESVFFNIPSTGLPLAQFWADINIDPCEESRLLTFDIVEPGTLGSEGVLKVIHTKVWAEKGEIVPITAVFQNLGQTPVKSKFKGMVEIDGRIIGILESEEIVANVGAEINLTTFFTPKGPGRYIIKGIVEYGGKKTYEKTSVINVLGTRINYTLVILYLAIAALLVFIIYQLNKKRRPPHHPHNSHHSSNPHDNY